MRIDRLRDGNRWVAAGLRSLAGLILLTGAVAASRQQPASPSPQVPAPGPAGSRSAMIDVIVLDSSNRPLTKLGPEDLRVTLDGEPRAVVGIQYVVKGRGAVAAARSLSADSRVAVTAEASRLVVLAIDEESIHHGSEKQVSEAVGRVVDNLAGADQLLLVPLPLVPPKLAASADRDTLRDGLTRLVGRAVPEAAMGQPGAILPLDPTTPPDDDEINRDRSNLEARAQQQLRDQRRDPADLAAAGMQTGASSPTSLARLLENMRKLPGPKTVIVFSGGEHGTAAAGPSADMGPGPQFVAAADSAAAARAVVHAVHLPRAGSRQRDRDLERLATTSGGRSVTLSGGARDLDPIDSAMAGSYLLQVERRPDDDRRLRGLRVTTTRRGATVVAPARWALRDDPLPPPLLAEAVSAPGASAVPAPGPVAASPTTPARRRPRPAPRHDPELDAVLARVSDYLAGYIREFSNVVAEEVYRQHVNMDRPNQKAEVRRLRSDLLIIQLEGGYGWTPFRDVFEMDGVPVRDREERLQKLFLSGTRDAFQQATRISDESARLNLGPIHRTVNIPTLALEYLLPRAIDRSNWVRRGEENVQGVRAWRIDFEEWGTPTVIRTRLSEDFPAGGSIWVEPVTGRILKTKVRVDNGLLSMESTVLFARNDAIGIWTPVEMKEVYEQRNGTIGGDAKYLNFRRFQVTTEEAIKIPK